MHIWPPPSGSFLDATIDLTGTVYDDATLLRARQYLNRTIGRVDPRWLRQPSGRFGALWKEAKLPSVVALIRIADWLSTTERKMVAECALIFDAKLKEFLHSRSDAFDEFVLELRTSAWIARGADRIGLNPGPTVPGTVKNVDVLAIISGAPWVFIEATVCYVEAIEQWRKAVDGLAERLFLEVCKSQFKKELIISAPLGIRGDALTSRDFKRAIREVATKPNGTVTISARGDSIQLSWKSIDPVLSRSPTVPTDVPIVVPRGARIGNSDLIATAVVRKIRTPSIADEKNIAASIRNTLRRKRKQYALEHPYLLVLGNTIANSKNAVLEAACANMIFADKEFQWISGICIAPVELFSTNGQPIGWNILLNNAAKHPLPVEFLNRMTSGHISIDLSAWHLKSEALTE
jgi:hypothetical protein